MWRLAVVQNKGGVGKTALASGIAAALARQGVRVLLVDADPQGGATAALGVQPGRTLAHVLMEGSSLVTAECEARPRLVVVPADRSVAALDGWLYERPARQTALRDALAQLGGFDVALMDTAPGYSALNASVYLAGEGLVLPVAPDGLALRAVRQVEENLALLARRSLTPPPIVLVVPTFADRRHGRTAIIEAALLVHFGERVGPSLRVCSALAAAMANGQAVHEAAPHSTATEDLDAIAVRLRALMVVRRSEPTPAPAHHVHHGGHGLYAEYAYEASHREEWRTGSPVVPSRDGVSSPLARR